MAYCWEAVHFRWCNWRGFRSRSYRFHRGTRSSLPELGMCLSDVARSLLALLTQRIQFVCVRERTHQLRAIILTRPTPRTVCEDAEKKIVTRCLVDFGFFALVNCLQVDLAWECGWLVDCSMARAASGCFNYDWLIFARACLLWAGIFTSAIGKWLQFCWYLKNSCIIIFLPVIFLFV